MVQDHSQGSEDSVIQPGPVQHQGSLRYNTWGSPEKATSHPMLPPLSEYVKNRTPGRRRVQGSDIPTPPAAVLGQDCPCAVQVVCAVNTPCRSLCNSVSVSSLERGWATLCPATQLPLLANSTPVLEGRYPCLAQSVPIPTSLVSVTQFWPMRRNRHGSMGLLASSSGRVAPSADTFCLLSCFHSLPGMQV